MAARPAPASRQDFRHFRPITTRWLDNDVYGHVNNVVYYLWFDTVVNGFLVERGLLDPVGGDSIGLVAETGCRYHASVSCPDAIEAGLALARLGSSSVEYRIGIFRQGDTSCAAEGRFVHVYVDRQTRRPVPVPDAVRAALAAELAL
jgi:acyl-CoA thioester hydrolase